MNLLERGDIDSINFGGHDSIVTQVRGYQNYDITDTEVIPINNPLSKRPWVDTKVKSSDFEKIIQDLQPNTYADFGCNLGYYVFKAGLDYVQYAAGVDYNPEYIDICNAIKTRHRLDHNCVFENTNLENWKRYDTYYDFMTVFNVIHHLYNRTETYMQMDKLISDFAIKADAILFEVPTEKDKKGHKWTMDTGYSEALFVESAENIFSTVTRMTGQTEHRPYYLCIK